jgi:tRNA (cmo5U34)-methyltransferase
VIVDKVQMPPGYVGTAFSRLTLQQKLAVGARPEAILQKELSLAGYQRPLDPQMLPDGARPFFQVGEFVGWIFEAPEC